MGRLREAIKIGEECGRAWPRDAQLQHWLGLAYFKAGQTSAAPGSSATIRSDWMAPSSTSISIWRWFCFRRMTPLRRPDELEKAIKLQPSHALAHVLLGALIKIPIARCRPIEQFQSHCASILTLRSGTTIWHSPTPAWDAIRKRSAEYEKESCPLA